MSHERERLRLPLQVGASSLRNLVIGSGLVAPSLAVTWIAFSVGSSNVIMLAGLGVGTMAAMTWWNGWRERPSDVLFDESGMRVDGGAHHGFALAWDALGHADIVEDGDAKALAVTDAAGKITLLATAEDASELASLEGVRDALVARSVLVARTAEAVGTKGQAAPAPPEPRVASTPSPGVRELLEQPSARVTTRWIALGLLFIASATPAVFLAFRRFDDQDTWSLVTVLALLSVPLLLLANGYFMARGRMVDRRALGALVTAFGVEKLNAGDPATREDILAKRTNERRKWRVATLLTLPFFAFPALVGKQVAAHATDEAPTAEATAFEADAPPVPPLEGASALPAGAHDVQRIAREDAGAALSYVTDTDAARPERTSSLVIGDETIVTTSPGLVLSHTTFDTTNSRVAFVAETSDALHSVRVLFTNRGTVDETTASVFPNDGIDPAWSLAGDHLAYATWSDQSYYRIVVVPTPTVKRAPEPNSGFGAVTWVTPAGESARYPSWNPQGTLIAFASNHGATPKEMGIHQVFVVDPFVQNKRPRQLTRGKADCTDVQWMADGWIRFKANGRDQRVKP